MSRGWTRLSGETVVRNEWLTIERNTYQAGARRIADYYVLRRPAFVLVVAEAPEGVILLRQYRPAMDSHYWSLPAGYLDAGEDALIAAARELREETGAQGSSFRLIGALDPLPGYIASRAHIVTCAVPGATPLRPSEESDQIAIVPWGQVLQRIASGAINEMQAVSALLLAARWRTHA